MQMDSAHTHTLMHPLPLHLTHLVVHLQLITISLALLQIARNFRSVFFLIIRCTALCTLQSALPFATDDVDAGKQLYS